MILFVSQKNKTKLSQGKNLQLGWPLFFFIGLVNGSLIQILMRLHLHLYFTPLLQQQEHLFPSGNAIFFSFTCK